MLTWWIAWRRCSSASGTLLEQDFLTAQFTDFQTALGPADTIVRMVLAGTSPAAAAATVLRGTRLADPATVAAAVSSGALGADDPIVALAAVLAPRQATYAREFDPSAGAT